MPSLSQNFIFLPENTIYLNYPFYEPKPENFFTLPLKGKGYYNNSGIHTLHVSFYNFKGSIAVEGTLEINPDDQNSWAQVQLSKDTYAVDTTGVSSPINIKSYSYDVPNFGSSFITVIGNYTYLRIKVFNFQQGQINYIKYNY